VQTLVVEAAPEGIAEPPSFDVRNTALAPTTRRFFQALGLWDAIAPAATPIREIHVSDQGRFGFTRMSAADEGLEALGWVVPNHAIGAALRPALAAAPDVVVRQPARIASAEASEDAIHLRIAGGDVPCETVEGRLLCVAEGARSATRESLGISLAERPYGQSAVIATVRPARDPRGRAFERFTPSGPLALLPVADGCVAVVWTVRSAEVDAVLALDDRAFLARLQEHFGYRLGRLLAAGPRHAYPLSALTARRFISRRAVVLGNAAHTLHPVAGQGFNLAVRDVAVLAELIAEAAGNGADPGAEHRLARYERLRRRDYHRTLAFTDGLVRLFSNGLPGFSGLRNAGLVGLDLLPGARRALMRQAMGRAGWLPRLARGLPLAERTGDRP